MGAYASLRVRTEDLEYVLRPELVAREPAEPRDSARLLVDQGEGREPLHRRVWDLPDLLEPGDVVVLNSSRVRKARLLLHRETGGGVEVLLVERLGDGWWRALVRPAARLREGEVVRGGNSGNLRVLVGGRVGRDGRLVRILDADQGVESAEDAALREEEVLEHEGEVPLPPYLKGVELPPERYQTVFARNTGSVAAPTAGLHLTGRTLEELVRRGVNVCEVELHVGPGTFRPLSAERLEDHEMEAERYVVPDETVAALERARRVVAVGTTVVRTLETFAATGVQDGYSKLFIRRGYRFLVVDALMTNFHLPRSTTLAMVDAFVGDRWRILYETAMREGYRFLSLGDAMILGLGGPDR